MFSLGFHRRSIAAFVAVLTIGVGVTAYDQAHAATPTNVERLEVAATALKPAVRLSQLPQLPPAGSIMFPMNPLPKCSLSKTSFGQPRPGGRIHQGIDLMSSLGQEIYAVGNGKLIKKTIDGNSDATLSGNAWKLQMSDGTGTYYFYAHLSTFAAGLSEGDSVTIGQVIGYVGDTGDAGPGNYHLHFEVHPKGGDAVDPYPLLSIPKACGVFP
jgi:murein DD-endopeptidase MepM/ murein hydrolase activator NlpD